MMDVKKGFRKVMAAGAGVLLLWLAGACVESDVGRQTGGSDWLAVKIPTGVYPLQSTAPVDTKSVPDTTFRESRPDSLPGMTRAGEVTYKRAIVLQYKSGNLINTGHTDIENYSIGTSISASLQAGEGCNIYVLAVNETTTSGSDAVFTTEAGLKSASYDLYNLIPEPTDNDIPLTGSLTNVNVVRLTVDGTESGLIQQGSGETKVELSRIAAKLNMTMIYDVSGYKVIASSGKIRNVPSKMYFTEQEGAVFPAEETASAFVDVPFTVSDCDGDNNDQPATTLIRYLPANIRGTNPAVTLPREKYSGTAPKTSVDRCTYITFTAEEKKNTSHTLVYSFYLGGNTTSDFNIRRNYIYTMNSTIAQAGEGDLRVGESGKAPAVITEPLAQGVSSTGAALRATLTTFGTTPTEYGFYYREGHSFEGATGATKVTASNLSGDNYSVTLSGLTAKKVYYYRAYAVCGSQTIYGSLASFSTNADGAPVLATVVAPVSAANGLSATSTGNSVTGMGILSQGIVYSQTGSFDHLTGGTRVDGTPAATSPFTVTLGNLSKGTDYYYRHYASNAQGYVYSASESSFRTKDTPSVPTGGKVASTVVNQLTFSAALPERKNAVDDYPTAAGVKYWTSDPGTDLSSAGNTLSFTSPQATGSKSVNWADMAAGQGYWYSFYSTNGVGTEYSAKQNFTSSALLPDPNPKTKEIGPQAVNGAFTVTTARNTSAAVTSGTGVSVASGNGTASKSINMAANTVSGSSRTTTLTFTTAGELPLRSNTMTVTQYGVVFSASYTDVTNIPNTGQTAKNVDVPANIPWQASNGGASWCTIGNGSQTGANTKDGDTKSFTYTVAKNEGVPREATITVQGTGAFTAYTKTFKVYQLTGTWLNINQADQTTGPQATDHTLAVTSNTTWTVASNNTGVATVSPASGSNNANVTVSVKANTTTNSRTATVSATPAGNTAKSYTVTQYGVVFPAFFTNVTNVVASGQVATNVSVTSNITWQATSNADWCTITNGSQTGANTQAGDEKNFTYTVAANTSAAREATITVKGTGSFTGFSKTFTVTQKAGYQGNLKPNDPTNNNQTNEFK